MFRVIMRPRAEPGFAFGLDLGPWFRLAKSFGRFIGRAGPDIEKVILAKSRLRGFDPAGGDEYDIF